MDKTELTIRILLIYSIVTTIIIFAANFINDISYIGIQTGNHNYTHDHDGWLLSLEIFTNLISFYYVLKFLFFFIFISQLKLNQPNCLRLSIAIGRVAYPLAAAIFYFVNSGPYSEYYKFPNNLRRFGTWFLLLFVTQVGPSTLFFYGYYDWKRRANSRTQ